MGFSPCIDMLAAAVGQAAPGAGMGASSLWGCGWTRHTTSSFHGWHWRMRCCPEAWRPQKLQGLKEEVTALAQRSPRSGLLEGLKLFSLFTHNVASKGHVSALCVLQLFQPCHSAGPEFLFCDQKEGGRQTSEGEQDEEELW